jgi:molecular chaperone Hsp33
LAELVNRQGQGRCAITLDPLGRQPGQQPYQGVVPLTDDQEQPLHKLSDVLELYMRQSEQLDTKLVLASNDTLAAGLLIQRLPIQGAGNLEGLPPSKRAEIEQLEEDYNRIATLAASLKAEELLSLDVDTILRRLFWEEKLQRFEPELEPRFHCTCSRERVSQMIQSLGEDEAQDIIAEQGAITVDCDFCGSRYVFDSVQASQLFMEPGDLPPSSPSIQ